MKFIVIRSAKTDKFTMHATTCNVVKKHFGRSYDGIMADVTATSVAECKAEMAVYAEECGWDEAPEIKVCQCAKA